MPDYNKQITENNNELKAIKQLADNLPPAIEPMTETKIGGAIAKPTTLEDNKEVHIDPVTHELRTSGGDSVTIDSEMSDTSTNPVQNKVVKKYVDNNSSGEKPWKRIGVQEVDGSTSTIRFTQNEDGSPIRCEEYRATIKINGTVGGAKRLNIQPGYKSGVFAGYNFYNDDYNGADNVSVIHVSKRELASVAQLGDWKKGIRNILVSKHYFFNVATCDILQAYAGAVGSEEDVSAMFQVTIVTPPAEGWSVRLEGR